MSAKNEKVTTSSTAPTVSHPPKLSPKKSPSTGGKGAGSRNGSKQESTVKTLSKVSSPSVIVSAVTKAKTGSRNRKSSKQMETPKELLAGSPGKPDGKSKQSSTATSSALLLVKRTDSLEGGSREKKNPRSRERMNWGVQLLYDKQELINRSLETKNKQATTPKNDQKSVAQPNQAPRKIYSMETTFRLFKPWNSEFIFPSVIAFVITLLTYWSKALLELSNVNANEFSRHVNSTGCKGEFHHVEIKDIDRNLYVNRTEYGVVPLLRRGRDYRYSNIMAITLIVMPFFFVRNRIRAKNILVGCCMISSISIYLAASLYYVQLRFGMNVHMTAVLLAAAAAVVTAFESGPKHVREFAVFITVIAMQLAELCNNLTIINLTVNRPFLLLSALWGGATILCYFKGSVSIHFLLWRRKTDDLMERFQMMFRRFSATPNLNPERIIDDILYSGRHEEPENALELIATSFRRVRYVGHLAFYLYLTTVHRFFRAPEKNSRDMWSISSFHTFLTFRTAHAVAGVIGLMGFMLLSRRMRRTRILDLALLVAIICELIRLSIPAIRYDHCTGHGMTGSDVVQMIANVLTIPWTGAFEMILCLSVINYLELIPHVGKVLLLFVGRVVAFLLAQQFLLLQSIFEANDNVAMVYCLRCSLLLAPMFLGKFVRHPSEPILSFNDIEIAYGVGHFTNEMEKNNSEEDVDEHGKKDHNDEIDSAMADV